MDPSKDQNFVYVEGKLIPGELRVVQGGDWLGFVLDAVVDTDAAAYGGRIPALILDDHALFAEAMCRLVERPEVALTGFLRDNGNGAVVVARRVRFLEPRDLRRQAALLVSEWRRNGRIPPREERVAAPG